MAAPTYTEDLTDIDLAESISNWEESTDGNWDDGGGPTADADYPYLQDATAITQQCTKASISSLLVDAGTGLSLPTDGAYFVWQFFASSTGLDTYANGGMRVMVGNSLAAFYSWDVGGKDFGRNPYGGWMNHAVNPAIGSPDDTVGSPTSTEQFIGAAVKTLVAIGKGNPHAVDAVRYGRGSSIFEYGDSGDQATFSGFAAANDVYNIRWGLIQEIAGGYLYKGKMTLGTVTNAVYFEDENVSILIDNTPKVTPNFNTVEINNASSTVIWTNVMLTALGTASPGRLVMGANATLTWDLCQFVDMGAFGFGGTNSTCTNAAFRGCGQITANSATLSGSAISGYEGAADSSALVWDTAVDPNGELDDMEFTRGTASTHAIEFGLTSPTTMTLTGVAFSGYNASDAQTDSTLYFARTSGTITVNLSGCTGNISYKAAGTTVVNFVADPVTTQVTVKDINTQAVLEDARVLLVASDATGDFPYEESVTIVSA